VVGSFEALDGYLLFVIGWILILVFKDICTFFLYENIKNLKLLLFSCCFIYYTYGAFFYYLVSTNILRNISYNNTIVMTQESRNPFYNQYINYTSIIQLLMFIIILTILLILINIEYRSRMI